MSIQGKTRTPSLTNPRRKRLPKKVSLRGRIPGGTRVHRKEKQCQEEEAHCKPRKDATATFDHACVEVELPKKVSLFAGGYHGGTHVHRKERQCREENGKFQPRKDANATFLKRLRP